MKPVFCLLAGFISFIAQAQQPGFTIHELPLAEEIAYNENQFSGLTVYSNRLYMMSESRLQQGFEAKLYTLDIPQVEKHLADSTVPLTWKKVPIHHLDSLKDKMNAMGQEFEGLEAIIIDNGTVYFSVETTTRSPNCFLIKGVLTDSAVIMNTGFLVAMPKFKFPNDSAVYNAGFEAMVKQGEFLYSFYEYNYFVPENYVRVFNKYSFTGNYCSNSLSIAKLPFRITDITAAGNNHFTGINYFFKGDDDSVYRVPPTDTANYRLIKNGDKYISYCRLIDLELQDTGFVWKPLWEFPKQYHTYNWEGIAAYNDGYFIVNDKYGTKPPHSVLLYLKKQ